MAEAIKKISVARGYDVTRYALNCFGGAGGQHACDVADALAIKTVLIHPLSSLLSAYGMGLADIARASRHRASRSRSTSAALEAHRAARATSSPTQAVDEVDGAGRRAQAITMRVARATALRRLGHRASKSNSSTRADDAARLRERRTRAASASSIAARRS